MTDGQNTSNPRSSARRQARFLRIAAAVVFLMGIFGADLVYFLGSRAPASADILPAAGEDKSATRQAQTLMGQQTVMMDEMGCGLKKPGTQAVIVVVTATLAAGGCLFLARLHSLQADRGEHTGPPRD